LKIHDQNPAGLPPGAERTNSAQIQKQEEAHKSAKTGALGANDRSRHAPASAGSSVDKVQISSVANALHSEAVESPERTAWLAKIAEEIRAGRYQVDSAALSKRLVDDMIRE
jgi:anti-sigma28 factor (negative regulator of flagellin synthesis)